MQASLLCGGEEGRGDQGGERGEHRGGRRDSAPEITTKKPARQYSLYRGGGFLCLISAAVEVAFGSYEEVRMRDRALAAEGGGEQWPRTKAGGCPRAF